MAYPAINVNKMLIEAMVVRTSSMSFSYGIVRMTNTKYNILIVCAIMNWALVPEKSTVSRKKVALVFDPIRRCIHQ
jgi:hypothetical protein